MNAKKTLKGKGKVQHRKKSVTPSESKGIPSPQSSLTEIRGNLRGRIQELKKCFIVGIMAVMSMAFKFVRLTEGPSNDPDKNAIANLIKAFTGGFGTHLVVLDIGPVGLRDTRNTVLIDTISKIHMRCKQFKRMSCLELSADWIKTVLLIARQGGIIVTNGANMWWGFASEKSSLESLIEAIKFLDEAEDEVTVRMRTHLAEAMGRNSEEIILIDRGNGNGWKIHLKKLVELKLMDLICEGEHEEELKTVMLKSHERTEQAMTTEIEGSKK